MQRFIIIDGSSFIFRAFYALPSLSNKHGEETGAIYGVINMLNKIIKLFPSQHGVFCFDPGGPVFRHKILPEYKANRPPTDPSIKAQIPYIIEYIETMGWATAKKPGYEADDLIANLAKSAYKQGYRVLICTSDKDMAQLVNDGIKLYNTSTQTVMDSAKILDKYGVKPENIVDMLSFMGDTIDGISGVRGIGKKTASKLINEYHSIDWLLNNIDSGINISRKIYESIKDNKELLLRNKKLISLDVDVDISSNMDDYLIKEANNKKLTELNNHNGFNFTSNQVPRRSNIPNASSYRSIKDAQTLKEFLRLNREISFYFNEGYSIAGASNGIETCLFNLKSDLHKPLEAYLLDKNKIKISCDSKKTIKYLISLGFDKNIELDDILIMAYVLRSSPEPKFHKLVSDNLDEYIIESNDATRISSYAKYVYKLSKIFIGQLINKNSIDIYNKIDKKLNKCLATIEDTGVLIDPEILIKQNVLISREIDELYEKSLSYCPKSVNLASSKQLANLLFNTLSLPVYKKTPGGLPSTDEDTLKYLSHLHPFPSILTKHRYLTKLKQHLDKLPILVNPKTKRIHTRFSQISTITGRLSCNYPNLQNIPVKTEQGKNIRKAFIVPKGCKLISADYSQIELRIMAHISNDKNLCEILSSGEDIHSSVAAEIFETSIADVTDVQRRAAKIINFGIMYGMSQYTLARNIDIPAQSAKLFIDQYFAKYPGIRAYMRKTKEEIRSHGYVSTIFNRRIYIPTVGPQSDRTAINAPIQGSAAEVIKKAMIDFSKWLDDNNMKSKIILQIHDELLCEAPEDELDIVYKNIIRIMEEAVTLNVPLTVKAAIGDNWSEVH